MTVAKQPLAIFRPAASATVGLGHIRRCLTLAQTMERKGWSWKIALSDGSSFDDIQHSLGLSTSTLIRVPDEANKQNDALAQELKDSADLFVVDDYALEAPFSTAARAWAKAVMAIDDLADRPFDADILLNQNPSFSPASYSGLVPETCKVLTGCGYALLRDEFASARSVARDGRASRPSAAPSRILVSLGGTDDANVTETILSALAGAGAGMEIEVVVTSVFPYLEQVRAMSANIPGLRIHTDVQDMAGLMANVDIAIGAGGTSSYERACLGLPTVLVITADNQLPGATYLEHKGAALIAGHAIRDDKAALGSAVLEHLKHLRQDRDLLNRMSERAFDICDADGKWRVVEEIDRLRQR